MGYGHKVGFQVAAFKFHVASCQADAEVAKEHSVSIEEGRKIRKRLRRKELADYRKERERRVEAGREEVRAFHAARGRVLQ